tara:strand:+ start:9486 stop:9935 length:450 start_codon:yes stop_codon:yes gene_type:complete
MIKLTPKNPNALPKMHEDMEDAISLGIKQGMQKIGMHLTAIIKKDITKRSKGSVKGMRYNPNRKVKISPSGTSPNNDTGALRSSILWQLMGNDDEVLVGTTLNYGRFLEDGTRKMGARPYIKNNAESETEKMAEILTESIRKQLDRIGR